MSADDHFNQLGIPSCPLVIDDTHIRLENAPAQADLPAGVRPQDFWCRKQFFSIKAQVIGDSRHLIRDLGAKWAGYMHDAWVWQHSQAKALLESQKDTIQQCCQTSSHQSCQNSSLQASQNHKMHLASANLQTQMKVGQLCPKKCIKSWQQFTSICGSNLAIIWQ